MLGIGALKNHIALDCEVQPIDLGRGDQLTPQYLALGLRLASAGEATEKTCDA